MMSKKILLSISLLFVFSEAHAQSEAVFRSLAIPGWGQFYNSQPMKGYVVIAVELITIAGYEYFADQQKKSYNKYSLSTNPFETHDLFDKVQTNKDYKKLSLSLMGAVWIYNVIDAYLNYDESKHSRLSSNKFDIEFENDGIKFSYSFSIKELRQNSKW